jgi:hypothetical protein
MFSPFLIALWQSNIAGWEIPELNEPGKSSINYGFSGKPCLMTPEGRQCPNDTLKIIPLSNSSVTLVKRSPVDCSHKIL